MNEIEVCGGFEKDTRYHTAKKEQRNLSNTPGSAEEKTPIRSSECFQMVNT